MNNKYYGKLIFELSSPGRIGYSIPDNGLADYAKKELDDKLIRKDGEFVLDELKNLNYK